MILSLLLPQFQSCKGDEDNEKKPFGYEDVEAWQVDGKPLPSNLFEEFLLFMQEDKWALVFVDDEDTVVLGPFDGHYPFDADIEYFEGVPEDSADDAWVMESLGPDGCVVRVFGKENGKLVLRNTYTIPGHNCQFGRADTAIQEKSLFFTNYGSDTVSVLRINFATGDSIYFGSSAGDIQEVKDIEVVNGRTITVRHENDTNYVTVLADDGTLIESFKFPGKFIRAMDDRHRSKIIITEVNGKLTYRVLVIGTPIGSGGDISQRGKLMDLQVHRVGNRSYYVVSSYDAAADVTLITFVGDDGNGIGTASLPGRLKGVQYVPDSHVKVFLTEDPNGNGGAGAVHVGAFDIATGQSQNPQPPQIRGRLQGVNLDNGTVTTNDGSQTNQTIVVMN